MIFIQLTTQFIPYIRILCFLPTISLAHQHKVLILISIYIGYRPSSPYAIQLGVDVFKFKRFLQNFRCIFCRISLLLKPHTLQPYYRMGLIICQIYQVDILLIVYTFFPFSKLHTQLLVLYQLDVFFVKLKFPVLVKIIPRQLKFLTISTFTLSQLKLKFLRERDRGQHMYGNIKYFYKSI